MTDSERLDFLDKHPNAVEWAYGYKHWTYWVRLMSKRAGSLREAIDGAAEEVARIEQRRGRL